MHNNRITTSTANLWEAEYKTGGIPSSVRDEPSGSVVDFTKFAKSHGIEGGLALDIGCGAGRNSIFLASEGYHVLAMDFVVSQVEALRAKAKVRNLAEAINAVVHDIRRPWPVDNGSADLLVDAFCFKHQIEQGTVEAYVTEANRSMRAGALALISFAGRNDGYYSRFKVVEEEGPGTVIFDEANQIASRLYDAVEVANLFRGFETVKTSTKRMKNVMHRRSYDRETHILYLRRL